jgi:hypothetical protein
MTYARSGTTKGAQQQQPPGCTALHSTSLQWLGTRSLQSLHTCCCQRCVLDSWQQELTQ